MAGAVGVAMGIAIGLASGGWPRVEGAAWLAGKGPVPARSDTGIASNRSGGAAVAGRIAEHTNRPAPRRASPAAAIPKAPNRIAPSVPDPSEAGAGAAANVEKPASEQEAGSPPAASFASVASLVAEDRPAIEFDRVEAHPGAVSFRIRALDRGPARRLSLWRLVGEEATPIAEAWSDSEGRVDFGPVLAPLSGLRLAATEQGRPPDARDREAALEILPELPAPRVTIESSDAGELWLEIRSALPGGRVVLADSSEAIFESIELLTEDSTNPDSVLSLELSYAGNDGVVLVAQVAPDGRSSDWRVVAIGDIGAIEDLGEDAEAEAP